MKEKIIEQKLIKTVKEAGGIAPKVTSPGSRLGKNKNDAAAAHIREAAALYANLMERTTTTFSLILEMPFFTL
jgi:hypothetical protein